MLDVLLFPLFVFAVAFEFGDERVEGDRLVRRMGTGMGMGRFESEAGTEFEAAVTVRRVVVVEGRVRREEKENN